MANLGVMTPLREGRLTVSEAARRLDMSIETLLDRVYGGELPATLQPETGRLLMDARDIERLRTERSSPRS